jgi:uncharacterized protein YjcR
MTAAEIAEVLTLALSTVSLWLKRMGWASDRGWSRGAAAGAVPHGTREAAMSINCGWHARF